MVLFYSFYDPQTWSQYTRLVVKELPMPTVLFFEAVCFDFYFGFSIRLFLLSFLFGFWRIALFGLGLFFTTGIIYPNHCIFLSPIFFFVLFMVHWDGANTRYVKDLPIRGCLFLCFLWSTNMRPIHSVSWKELLIKGTILDLRIPCPWFCFLRNSFVFYFGFSIRLFLLSFLFCFWHIALLD